MGATCLYYALIGVLTCSGASVSVIRGECVCEMLMGFEVDTQALD